MNDNNREKLSAYLDGALSETERRAVEVEISRSEDMRLELEALRAVSNAVKALPKEPLPAGFMARLEARRAREGSKPSRDYFILPPSYRPLAFALSTAVVALVIWDKTTTPLNIVESRAGWENEKVAIKSTADAPPSINVSGQLAALDHKASGADALMLNSSTAKKEDAAQSGASSTLGKHISAPGKPLELQEADNVASYSGGGAGPRGFAAPTAPAADAQPGVAEGTNGTFLARNEEERSAINERLYKGFEEEKKRMGIARIVDKDAETQNLPSGGREMMALRASPEAANLDRGRSSMAAVRGAKAKREPAPAVKALTLKSPEELLAAWAAAGLPGEPPAVNFPDQMAIFLAGPAGCGITDIQNRKKFIVVLYKPTGFEDAAARVRAVALSPKPVVIKLAQ